MPEIRGRFRQFWCTQTCTRQIGQIGESECWCGLQAILRFRPSFNWGFGCSASLAESTTYRCEPRFVIRFQVSLLASTSRLKRRVLQAWISDLAGPLDARVRLCEPSPSTPVWIFRSLSRCFRDLVASIANHVATSINPTIPALKIAGQGVPLGRLRRKLLR